MITRYHIILIALYLMLLPAFFIWMPEVLNYDFSLESIWILVFLLFISLVGLNSIFRIWKIKAKRSKLNKIILSSIYALVFAVPEEIIFRGIVQGFFQDILNDNAVIVFLSSIVYASVHLPHGAKGLALSKWNWRFFSLTFAGGIIFGTAFILTQSLLVPTILHAILLVYVTYFIKRE